MFSYYLEYQQQYTVLVPDMVFQRGSDPLGMGGSAALKLDGLSADTEDRQNEQGSRWSDPCRGTDPRIISVWSVQSMQPISGCSRSAVIGRTLCAISTLRHRNVHRDKHADARIQTLERGDNCLAGCVRKSEH